jgi:hypothetical protein
VAGRAVHRGGTVRQGRPGRCVGEGCSGARQGGRVRVAGATSGRGVAGRGTSGWARIGEEDGARHNNDGDDKRWRIWAKCG